MTVLQQLLYPRKSGILWIIHSHRRCTQISCVEPAEFKLYSGESKHEKFGLLVVFKLNRTVSFRFFLYLVHELVGMMSCHPIFFIGLGSKSSD